MATLAFLVSFVGAACAQNIDWVARYNDADDGPDVGRKVAIDGANNTIVIGLAWSTAHDNDFLTIKYDTNGHKLWARRFDGPFHGYDEAIAVGVDTGNNVYVAGTTTGLGNQFDYTVVKYSPSGNRLWARTYDGPSANNDVVESMFVDASANVYVAGASWGVTDFDFATVKYDGNGNRQWVKRFDGPTSGDDEATAIGVDANGNVSVSGFSWSDTTGYDIVTIRYDSTGKVLWKRRHHGDDSAGEDRPISIVCDGGNTIVLGQVAHNAEGKAVDLELLKYNSSGSVMWKRDYDGPTHLNDWPRGLAVDASGEISVAASSQGKNGDFDYVTLRYDANGLRRWVQRYAGASGGDDDLLALAIDGSSNTIVTGSSTNGNETDCTTIKYSPAGQKLWVRRYKVNNGLNEVGNAVEVSGDGHVVVTGYGNTAAQGSDVITLHYAP